MQPEEFETRPLSEDVQTVSDMWVDTRGDIWMAGVGAGERVHFGRALWHVPLKGFDEQHNPIYQLSSVVSSPAPDEFGTNPVTRIIYDADHDVMYLSGTTTVHPKSLNPVGAGSEIIRYDLWSTPRRKVRWRIVLPEDRTERSKEDAASGAKDSSWFEAFAIAGDRLFAVQRARSDIFAFGLDTGALIGKFGPAEGEIAGAADMGDGLHAFQRKSGEYLVFAENDYTAAIMLYRLPRF